MARKPPKVPTFVNPPASQQPSTPAGDPAPDIERLTGSSGGIGPIGWDPNGPRTRNTPFGRAVTAMEDAAAAAPAPAAPAYDPYAAYMDNQESNRRRNAIAALRGILESMGLGSLMNKITQYVQDGYDEGAVLALIRDTPEYQQRFPAMKALAAKGRAISEATYIEYEKAAAGYERQYGLPAGLLGKDQITNLLTKEVSARELEERVTMAAAAAYQTSDDVKQMFNDYYGIGPGGLTAYFLDPDAATPLLNRQYVSSKIGGEARRQGIGVDKSLAELLQIGGVTAEDARAGFAKVAQQRGLTSGYGDVVSERQLIGAALQNDTEAQQAVERAGMARVGAFQGNFGYSGNQSGASGLRSATTG